MYEIRVLTIAIPSVNTTNTIVAKPKQSDQYSTTGKALPRPRGRPSVGAKGLRGREQNRARVKKSRMEKKLNAVNSREEEVRAMLTNMFLNFPTKLL